MCYLSINEWLLEEDGHGKIRTDDDTHFKMKRHHRVVTQVTKVIREKAREAAGNGYKFDEYLASTFLVLFGVLRYQSYDPLLAVHARGLMAKRILREDFGR